MDVQGIPPQYRPWVWLSLSGAAEKQREHIANYYDAMVHMGESASEFAHQIDLVRLITQPHTPLIQGDTDISRCSPHCPG